MTYISRAEVLLHAKKLLEEKQILIIPPNKDFKQDDFGVPHNFEPPKKKDHFNDNRFK